MSNRNNRQAPNNGNANGSNPAGNGQPKGTENPPKAKKTLRQRISNLRHKVMANKHGHRIVRATEGILGVGAGAVGGFLIGRKTAKPTIVYVEPVKDNEEPAEEEKPEEEPVEAEEQD